MISISFQVFLYLIKCSGKDSSKGAATVIVVRLVLLVLVVGGECWLVFFIRFILPAVQVLQV
jgi:hypothetical protein